jgi:hypothetical protein
MPFQHAVVLFVLWVGHSFEKVGVAREPTHIFRGTSPDSPDKTRVCGTRDGIIDFLDLDHMVPVVAKVIDVIDCLGADIFERIQQAGFTGGQWAIIIAVRIRDAPADAGGPELVKVTVGSAHGGLDHIVQTVQLDLQWHIEAPQYLGLDVR